MQVSRRPLLSALILVSLAAGGAALVSTRQRPGDHPGHSSVYRNARPGVRYVGDAACTRCHAEIAASYRNHPMGRSLAPIGEAPAEVRGGAEPRTLFRAQGFEYTDVKRGGRTVHGEARRDARGRVVGQVEGEVRYVLGSGRHAVAFLIGRGDYLFQSPVTWYAQTSSWGLAPGFEGKQDARFERQITPGCLACHANRVEHVAGTEGRYRPPVFHGHAIGCERCHGPGELHARRPTPRPEDGPNIVNPRDLAPSLRESVCEQCHLVGGTAIARAGRDLADYRPGLALHDFLTVFVNPPGRSPGGDHRNADHVEQMHRSRCYMAAGGAMGCISCHDPHELPRPEQRVAYYRDRCTACHAQRGCALPVATRLSRSPEDSCIECHMPRAATSDVPHVATTLHNIPRTGDDSDGGGEAAGADASLGQTPDPTDLVPFHRDLMSPADLRHADRDLGVALRHRGRAGAARARPLLEAALAERPDDVLARESLGFALWGEGRTGEGLAAFEAVLAREPNRESALEAAALLAARLRRHDLSADYWRRAAAVDPWRSSFQAELAGELNRLGRWPAAAAAARSALRINPASRPARAALILSSLRSGAEAEARAQFETFLEFADPAEREGLVRQFESTK